MKILLLGSGELGKEFTISAKRLGIEVVAVDSYDDAPAMTVSDQREVIDMKNEEQLTSIVEKHKPDYIVPEIEAINTDVLSKFTDTKIVPSVKAIQLTMNRDLIRDHFVSIFDKSLTSNYSYVDNYEDFVNQSQNFSLPFVVKPCMSSSGKGQTIVRNIEQIEDAWKNATNNSRGNSNKIIIEEFIDFDYEVTMLTVVGKYYTYCLKPIIHYQENGDYRWSSQNEDDYFIDDVCLKNMEIISKKICKDLCENDPNNSGIFGVEFFVKRNKDLNTFSCLFSEVSPRPHDTGLVTLRSQNYSQFDLHLRSLIGWDVNPKDIKYYGGVSVTLNAKEYGKTKINYEYLPYGNYDVLFFGKKQSYTGRRLGVILADNLSEGFAAKTTILNHVLDKE